MALVVLGWRSQVSGRATTLLVEDEDEKDWGEGVENVVRQAYRMLALSAKEGIKRETYAMVLEAAASREVPRDASCSIVPPALSRMRVTSVVGWGRCR